MYRRADVYLCCCVHMILKIFAKRRSMNAYSAAVFAIWCKTVHHLFAYLRALVLVSKCMFGVGSLKMNQLCGRPENKH